MRDETKCHDCTKNPPTEGRRCADCAERHRIRNRLAYARAKERGRFVR